MLPLKQQIITVQPDIHPLGQTSQSASYFDIGSGTPVLMLHGFMGNKDCWLPLIQQLKLDCRCVSLDLLGFGESGKPKIRYDVATEVAFVRQVTLALQLDPCYILGHSFGGWVAAAYALKYPASVKGLLLAAPAGIRDDSFCGRYDHLRPLLWQTPVVDWLLQLAKLSTKIVGKSETLEKISWFRGELNAQPAARSFLVDRMRPEDAVDTVEKEIHQLRVPTLVISGDRDETIPLWHSETYAREIPGAQLVTIPEASHSLPQDYAPELAALILPFLERLKANAL
ncbi:MAG: alpha/beta hydrolase [Cyanobacteriota bacterium]|nr:alpha/beta hydrolase [Cyanobacteriota bacterium]